MTHIVDIPISPMQDDIMRSAIFSPQPGFMVELPEKNPGRVRRIGQKPDVIVPVSGPWSGVAFRPKTEQNTTAEIAVACGGNSTKVRRFDLELGGLIEENHALGLVELFMPRAHCVAYSHNGRFLAMGSTDGLVRVYDLMADHLPKEVCCVRVGKSCITALAFTATSDTVFVISDTHAYIISPLNEQAVAQLYLMDKADKTKPTDRDIYCLATHPQIPLAAFAGSGGEVVMVDVNAGHLLVMRSGVGEFVRELSFIEGQQQQLTVVGQLGAEVFDLASKTIIGQWKRSATDQKMLGSCSYGDTVYVART